VCSVVQIKQSVGCVSVCVSGGPNKAVGRVCTSVCVCTNQLGTRRQFQIVQIKQSVGCASVRVCQGHDARPTPDSRVETLDRKPESGVSGCPPYSEQT